MYDPDDCLIDPAWAGVNAALPAWFRWRMEQEDAPERRIDPDRLPAHRQQLAHTYGLITQIDDAVGRLVEHLDLSLGVLFFTSDHGDFAGHRGLVRKIPWLPFDDLARVPFFATGGWVAGGRRETSPVQSFDLAATALAFAGVEPPPELDGVDLGPLLTDEGAAARNDRLVFSAVSMKSPMARRGRYKYIRLGTSGDEVLFDMEADPDESVNLLDRDDLQSVLADLRHAVDDQITAAPADLPTFDPRP
jgi:choline-sulfatase